MIPPQYLLSLFERISMAGRFPPAVQFLLNHAGIFQKTQQFLPDHGIEVVLANRRIIANRSLQVTISIGTQAPVVIKPARRGGRRGAIERIAAALTNQHPLQQGRFDGAPGRMPSVLLQLLLRQGESLFADQARNRNLDPILAGPLVVGAVAARQPLAFPQPSRDALPRSELGLPKPRPAPVGRIA